MIEKTAWLPASRSLRNLRNLRNVRPQFGALDERVRGTGTDEAGNPKGGELPGVRDTPEVQEVQ